MIYLDKMIDNSKLLKTPATLYIFLRVFSHFIFRWSSSLEKKDTFELI